MTTAPPATTAPTIRLARPDDREAIWRLLGELAISFSSPTTGYAGPASGGP